MIVTCAVSVHFSGVRTALHQPVKRATLIAVVLSLSLMCLPGATLARLSLTDMAAQSTSIVRAKVLDSYAVSSGPAIFTHYKVQVGERLKGPGVTEVVVWGGTANGIQQVVPGAPRFNKGDEYVFFPVGRGRRVEPGDRFDCRACSRSPPAVRRTPP